ncbi:hypothetical protein [Mycolicibacterium neoaurum]|uniref:hypothetical protein n=1 Tax=Mycolicibacterium neoaurum TaxID=1795 RepID=UPI001F4D34D3|nr:hypothetical protein [Mycolicibacterium neoaurum]
MMTYQLSPEEQAIYDRNTYRGPLPKQVEAVAPVKPTRHPLAGRTPGVRATSRTALKNVKIGEDEAAVLAVLRMHNRSLCDREILDYCQKFTDKGSRWDINQINGRRHGLLTKGLIEEDARWKCDHSSVPTIHWKVVAEAQS